MPSWLTFNVAAFLPFGFALVSLLCAWRSIRYRALYAVLAVFVFAGAQDIGMAPQQDWLPRKETVVELLARDTKEHLLADIVSATIGGFVMWRVAKAFRSTHEPATDSRRRQSTIRLG